MTETRDPVSLTFVIPVRHQDNAKDWPALKWRLSQTLASIANQDCKDWRAVVVANYGAELPKLPDQISAVRVDFPPNDMHELDILGRAAFYDAFRWDKGRRVLSGMLAARDSRFFMIVDDDDFVSNRLASFARAHPGSTGWKIRNGYVWSEGGHLVMKHHNFHFLCGTSLIIRKDAYELPASFEEADVDWVKDRLGSHIRIGDILAEKGTPLEELPFYGAVYRVGHTGSHSQAAGIIRQYILNAEKFSRPKEILRDAKNLRYYSASLRREFTGLE